MQQNEQDDGGGDRGPHQRGAESADGHSSRFEIRHGHAGRVRCHAMNGVHEGFLLRLQDRRLARHHLNAPLTVHASPALPQIPWYAAHVQRRVRLERAPKETHTLRQGADEVGLDHVHRLRTRGGRPGVQLPEPVP